MIVRPTYIKLNLDFDAEPNAPSPEISINDSTLILKFLLNPFLWDDVEDDEQAELRFNDVLKYRFGGPGSDNFSDFRYYDKGIDNYGFYQLKNSNWTKDFPLDEKVISKEPNSSNDNFKHYVFFFRDNTFECIAEGFKFVRTDKIIKFEQTMNHEVLILQKSPRVEIVFYEAEFEIKKSGSVLVDKTVYNKLQVVDFIKGKIPWFTGILTTVIDLISGHGVGQWKRGKGKLELITDNHNYSIELMNYDREQTPVAIEKLNAKI